MPFPLPAHQIAGALLEEAILAVLEHSGFRTLTNLIGDLTIDPQAPPITIYGRATKHQIDAVADPVIGYPFSNPARLLVEAKAYAPRNRVGLDIVRNALGTLTDLSEFWRPDDRSGRRMTRYHYRYAIFSSSEFTEPAQAFAYCHDIYLLPLRRSAFFLPIVTAIDNLRKYFQGRPQGWHRFRLSNYRQHVREAIRGEIPYPSSELEELVQAVEQVRVGMIGVAGRQFPLFLTPRNPRILEDLEPVERVRIFWDEQSWYLRRPGDAENLFSFDLPTELFKMYATEDRSLGREEALRLKAERLVAIQSFIMRNGRPQIIQFELDRDWIDTLLERTAQRTSR